METQEPTGQAERQPVEDRIASMFGGDEPEAPEQPLQDSEETSTEVEAAQAPEDFDYEYEGATYKLPKALEKAVMQQKDYTQKTQEVAEIRRNLELRSREIEAAALERDFHKEVSADVRQLQMYDAALEQANDPAYWANMTNEQRVEALASIQRWNGEKAKLLQNVQQKYGEYQAKRNEANSKIATERQEAIKKLIPAWTPELAKEITDYAVSKGIPESRLSSYDAAEAQMAWEALQYRKLQAKATPAAEKAKGVKPTPSRPMPADVKDRLNYRKALQKTQPNSPERRAIVQDRVAKLFGG